MMSSTGFMRALRVNGIALLGSDGQATRELFQLLDAGAASDYRYAKALLQGRKTLPWVRDWQEKRSDPQLHWAHPSSHATGAPDLYTPLSSVLLASPRHRLAAMLQKWGLAEDKDAAVQMQLGGANAATAVASVAHKKAALQFLELPVSSLGGLTARRVKALGPGGNCGDAARSALAEWRLAAAQLLLESAAGESLVSFVDARGRTALHHAAAAGDARIVEMLLEAGAQPHIKDQHGRSAGHHAAVQRFPALAAQLAQLGGDAQDVFGHTVESLLEPMKGVTTVKAEDFSFDADFIPSYVSVNRPVLIKGGALHLEAMSWSDYRHLQADLGSEVVAAAPVPYSKNMGLSGGVEAPLAELLSSPKLWRSEEPSAEVPDPLEPPCYVFDASVLRRRRDVARRATALGTAFMEKHCSHVRVPQFGVGFRGAGASMHSHHAALNAAFAGRKRWFLMPPEVASWSLEPVATWKDDKDHYKSQRDSGLLFELEQEPGDLLFVPEGWGHATILESYAVGVAQEFVPWTSIHG